MAENKKNPGTQKKNMREQKKSPQARDKNPREQKKSPQAQNKNPREQKKSPQAQDKNPREQKQNSQAQNKNPQTQNEKLQEQIKTDESGKGMDANTQSFLRPTAGGRRQRTGNKFSFGAYETLLLYGLSFLLPVIILLLIFVNRGFYPFGGKTLFIMDMRDQYVEFFASLRNVISGDDSLFLSWSRSMGGNYLGLFAYYIASPLSFLTVFFPVKKLTCAIMLLTLLKIGLAGMSFAFYGDYLWKHSGGSAFDKRAGKTPREDGKYGRLLAAPLAVSYALISYNMVYSMCLMWLDGVIFLPLILLGVEKILDGGKGLQYMLALAGLFYCNYYTGYMVGIFTAIYTVYRILCRVEKKSVKEYGIKFLRIGITTLFAFGISAPLLFPVIKDLVQGKLSTASYMPDSETNFIFAELLSKLKNGVYDSITNSGLPAIYCGYAALGLAALFFVLRGISLREKAGALLILALSACSFYFTKWDIAWHGFRYPNWFPYRYAFVCSFFLLYMALRSMGVMCGMKWVGRRSYGWILTVLAAAVSADMYLNADAMFDGLERQFGYGAMADYEAFLDKTQPLVEQVKEQDEGFYRINQGYEYSKNDAMLLGYHGMTHYSSTFHGAVNALTKKLGLAQAHIWNSGYGSNPLLDSLFAVKYILEDGMVPAEYSWAGGGSAAVYENGYALPIAYGAPCINLNPNLNTGDPFSNQNAFLNAIAGTNEAYFTSYPYITEQTGLSWSYTFIADSANPVYLYMKPIKSSKANVYVNGTWAGNYFSTETNCSLFLGNFQPGQQVEVRIEPSGEAAVSSAVIAQLHMDLLERTLAGLSGSGMRIERHGNGKLSGRIQLGENQKIITSIPYDSGWTVKVDGRKAAVTKFADTFLAVEAGSGEHEISFSYVSPGFGMGTALFAAAAAGAAVYFGMAEYVGRIRLSKK